MQPYLTIAIPTYNRNETVLQTVEKIIPQLRADTRLLIIDNCSDISVSQTLNAAFPTHPATFEVHRNAVNCGGNVNIMKCFEVAATSWIWVLGDDDEVLPNAVETIYNVTTGYSDAYMVNFRALCPRPSTFTTLGLTDFVKQLDSFSNALFLSTSVFNGPKVACGFTRGFLSAYTNAPHLALLIDVLDVHGQCVFSTDSIVRHYVPPAKERWSQVWHATISPMLCDILPTKTLQKALAKKIFDSTVSMPFVWRLALLRSAGAEPPDRENVTQKYERFISIRWPFLSTWQRLLAVVTLLFLRTPLLSLSFIGLLEKVVGKHSASQSWWAQMAAIEETSRN